MKHCFRLIGLAAAFAIGLLCQDSTRADEKSDREQALIDILTSDAPDAEKAVTCKRLAVYGTAAAVPELAKLLPDERLSSWARIALEAIPGSEADDALLQATESLDGKLLVGAINSLGVRRAESAAEKLITLLKGDNDDAASAAAIALGRIGNAAATESLRDALTAESKSVRSAAAEGCVLCAERALADGHDDEAIAIYDQVRAADVPPQRVIEATRGAILARNDEGIPLLIETLHSSDRGLFRIALGTAREMPGTKIDQALAEELPQASPELAALLIHAMADRKDTVVLTAVQQAAEQGPKPVRLVALAALGRVGNVSCLPSLLKVAVESDVDLVAAAKTALSDLPGATIDQDLVQRVDKAKGKTYPLLIELIGLRRIEALPPLLKAMNDADKTVRAAALTSLGATVPQEKLSVLIAAAVSPKHKEDAALAQQALKTAAIRMPDREACAEELSQALKKASTPIKVVLLEIVGAVAGTKSLETLAEAAKSKEPQLQDVSTKLLGEWMTLDAAPVLLDLSQTAPGYRTRALRGYIRIARQFVMPDEQRIEMCQEAFAASKQPAERRLVLEVLKRHANLETLKLAIQAITEYGDLKEEATQTALAIGSSPKLADKVSEVKDLLADIGLETVKLEIVKAEYGAAGNQKNVTEELQKAAGELQLITLPSQSYNEAFGGDPAPGMPKKLSVRYRINDKDGEASFAENSLVILPLPK